jgi:predicted nucleotidyltransferase component of viral defense system
MQANCPSNDFAETEFTLTHILQALSECGALQGLAFKGGTCIHKMLSGPTTRISTDLDFTLIDNTISLENIVLHLSQVTESQFHGFKVSIDLTEGKGWYKTADSFGLLIHYENESMCLKGGDIKVQVSFRAGPILTPIMGPQLGQQYFKELGFRPVDLLRLRAEEMLAEKIRALCQRTKARDLYDLNWYSAFPHNKDVIRKLVIIKMWETNDSFNHELLFNRLSNDMDWDWDDLASLLRGFDKAKGREMIVACRNAFSFLQQTTDDEMKIMRDKYCRQQDLANVLIEEIRSLAGNTEDQHWFRERAKGPRRMTPYDDE